MPVTQSEGRALSDTERRIDAIEDVTSLDQMMELEVLLSRELREKAGQHPLIAKLSSVKGDLLDGTTANALKRLKK